MVSPSGISPRGPIKWVSSKKTPPWVTLLAGISRGPQPGVHVQWLPSRVSTQRGHLQGSFAGVPLQGGPPRGPFQRCPSGVPLQRAPTTLPASGSTPGFHLQDVTIMELSRIPLKGPRQRVASRVPLKAFPSRRSRRGCHLQRVNFRDGLQEFHTTGSNAVGRLQRV